VAPPWIAGAAPVPVTFFLLAQVSLNPDTLRRFNSACSNGRESPFNTREYSSLIALHGNLVYFAAFKNHIGFYPPVRDQKLKKAVAIYAGEKGNLRFPLAQPIPYALIGRIVKARVRENLGKAGRKGKKTPRRR